MGSTEFVGRRPRLGSGSLARALCFTQSALPSSAMRAPQATIAVGAVSYLSDTTTHLSKKNVLRWCMVLPRWLLSQDAPTG